MTLRREVAGLPTVDVALAAALLVVKVGFVLTGTLMSPGEVGLALLTAVALTVPLAWRRTAPLAVALVVGAALAMDDLIAGWDAAVLSFDCAIVASYSAGAHARQPRAVAALAALMTANVVDALVAPGNRAGDLALAIVVFSLVPWLVGQALRRERRRTEQLRELSASLAGEREELARMAVAEERVRIARELHDVVAHAISVIAIQADAATKVLSRDPSRAKGPLSVIQTTARGTLAEMRRMVGLLRETDELAPRAPQPGAGDLAVLVEQARGSGSAVTLEVLGDVRPLSGPLDLTVFRIVQEGLTNVRKHAGPASALVRVCYGTELAVEVHDDGAGGRVGPIVEPERGGHGLVGIRERVSILGGTLETGPSDTGGFALRARLPYRTSAP